MRIVRFLRPVRGYRAGEMAGFDPDIAERLVRLGVAEYVEPERRALDAPPRDKAVKQAPRKRGAEGAEDA